MRSCGFMSSLYSLLFSLSSACVPMSATRPLHMTTIWSAFCTVLRRCAMTTTVRPSTKRCTACCTSRSLTLSSALVASSRMITGESLSSARASATRCRCPPDSSAPRSPTTVSYPLGSLTMNSCALAASAAARTSSAPAWPHRPYAMLSAIVPLNSTGSWPTIATARDHSPMVNSSTGRSSMNTPPACGW
mmetsp:Transcript_22513/g.67028  ORF Transcript_22513/g.67028 Transcript_22513/m.67028 type:complete len:190 (+) Transcript_22513:970-1539(+)